MGEVLAGGRARCPARRRRSRRSRRRAPPWPGTPAGRGSRAGRGAPGARSSARRPREEAVQAGDGRPPGGGRASRAASWRRTTNRAAAPTRGSQSRRKRRPRPVSRASEEDGHDGAVLQHAAVRQQQEHSRRGRPECRRPGEAAGAGGRPGVTARGAEARPAVTRRPLYGADPAPPARGDVLAPAVERGSRRWPSPAGRDGRRAPRRAPPGPGPPAPGRCGSRSGAGGGVVEGRQHGVQGAGDAVDLRPVEVAPGAAAPAEVVEVGLGEGGVDGVLGRGARGDVAGDLRGWPGRPGGGRCARTSRSGLAPTRRTLKTQRHHGGAERERGRARRTQARRAPATGGRGRPEQGEPAPAPARRAAGGHQTERSSASTSSLRRPRRPGRPARKTRATSPPGVRQRPPPRP